MIVINFFGGPGTGKSTLAATLFAKFKRTGRPVELVTEVAKDFVYSGRDLPHNQFLMLAAQYQKLKDVERAGTEVAITDGPLRMCLAYVKPEDRAFYNIMCARLCRDFTPINVFVRRAVRFQSHGRVQKTEADAAHFDGVIRDILPVWDEEATATAYSEDLYWNLFKRVGGLIG